MNKLLFKLLEEMNSNENFIPQKSDLEFIEEILKSCIYSPEIIQTLIVRTKKPLSNL